MTGQSFSSCVECVNPYYQVVIAAGSPLPIPNREVKPACADGTAMQCGRVGSRRLFQSEALSSHRWQGFVISGLQVFDYRLQIYGGWGASRELYIKLSLLT